MSGYGNRSAQACSALIVAVALVAAAPVFAQARPGLADRVARLEQLQAQAQTSNQNVEVLNRITDLQTEIQSLRDLVEKQQFEIEQLKQRSRQQYQDLDGRLGRIEGGSANAPAPASAASEQGESNASLPAPSDAAAVSLTAPPASGANPVKASGSEGSSADPAASQAPVSTGAQAPAALDERATYEQAFDALKNGQYAEAARRFQAFLVEYPAGEYAPNAHYWLGESYYVTQNYELAQASFKALLDTFPDSAKAPDALLKLGYCQYELKQFTQAQVTLNQVVDRYPDSTVARLAQGRLRALMLENRQ